MDRFASEWSEFIKFYMKTEIFQIENDPITMKEWVFEHDNYTCIQVLTKYFSSRKYIFIVKTQVLTIEASNTVKFPVVVRIHHMRKKIPLVHNHHIANVKM